MIEGIDFNKAKYIVEYGAGTGAFTEKLLKKRKRKTVVLLVENNKAFALLLQEKFKQEENVFIVHGSALNIEQHIKEFGIPYVDYVVSGLPFASLPQKISSGILVNTIKVLKNDGQFITFQYTKCKKAFIKRFFNEIDIKREYRNLPPAYVFSCTIPNRHMEGHNGVHNSNC